MGAPYTATLTVVGNRRPGHGLEGRCRLASTRPDAGDGCRRHAGRADVDLGHADCHRHVRRSRSRSATPTASCPTARRRSSTRSPSSRRSAARRRPHAADGHRRRSVQRDARDGNRRPRPLHVDRRGRNGARRADTRSRDRALCRGGPTAAGLLVLAQVADAGRPHGNSPMPRWTSSVRSTSSRRASERRHVGDPYKATLRAARRPGAPDVLDHRRASSRPG